MSVHIGSIWIDNNLPSVPKDIWVAVGAGGVLSEDGDLLRLMNNLAARSIPLNQVTIARLIAGVMQ